MVSVFYEVAGRYITFGETSPDGTPSFTINETRVPLVRVSCELIPEIVPGLERIASALAAA
jgi:hypothetical protein